MKTYSLLLLLLLPFFSFAQNAKVSNDYPQRGETIQIFYTPNSASKFTLDDEVYASMTIQNEDYSTPNEVIKMQREKERFSLEYKVGSTQSAIQIYFKTQEGYDRESTLMVQVKKSDGNYYRNGLLPSLFDNPENYIKELEAFPDNYAVYRSRWQLLPYTNKDSAQTIINQEIKRLQKKGKKNEAYYYALVCGQSQQGNFDEARQFFSSFLQKFPQSHLIEQAHSYYQYQLFANSAKDTIFPQIVLEFIQKYPQTELAKEQIMALYDKEGQIKNTEALSAIVHYWLEKEPDNAMLYYHHANTLTSISDKLVYLNKALNTFLDGDFIVKKGYTWNSSLPYSMYRLAKAFRALDAPGQALGIANLIEENYPEKEGYFVMQKGRILQDLHRYREALETYLIAADMGENAGNDSARSVFTKQGFYGDFEEYAQDYRKKQFYSEKVAPAPLFEAVDLQGNSYKLEELKGKVVVLNFWFIGCAPCRIEMPGLNEMVKEYKDKDVVFLAFALDSKESLEEFLTKTEFAYQIIPSATSIANLYEAEGFPTHIVIDKKGNIRSVLVGGSEDRHKSIKPLIDRALTF